MPRKIDMTGKTFGLWTVLNEAEERRNGKVYWNCRCACGIERAVSGSDLRNGSSTGCGCVRNQNAADRNSLNLLGQTFNRLTVIEKTDKRKSGMIVWRCKCDCGNEIEVPTSYLTSGDTSSCGCYLKERINETHALKLDNQRFGRLVAIEPTDERYDKNIVWKCKCDCGNTVYVSAHNLSSGATMSCGCLRSKGEEKISKLLQEYGCNYTIQHSFNSCRFTDSGKLAKFDFYINNEYLIEYDGEQHFSTNRRGWNTEENLEQTIKRDKYKNQWCKENEIPLIRIPYTQYDNLSINDLLLETTQFRII